MTVRAALLATLLGLSATPALAQPYWAGERDYPRYAPYSNYDEGLPPRAVNRILRAEGLAPVSPPARRGRSYIVHAADSYGGVKRVTIDARYGTIVSIQAVGRSAPQRFGYGRPGRYDDGPWYDAPPRPRAGLTPPADDRLFVPRPRARIPSPGAPELRRKGELPAPPRVGSANPAEGKPDTPAGKREPSKSEPSKGERTAVVAPAKPPLPRERPANLPQSVVAKPDATPEPGKPETNPAVAKPETPAPAAAKTDSAKPETSKKPDAAKPVAAKPEATTSIESKPTEATPASKPPAAKPVAPARTATTATSAAPASTPAASTTPRVILPGGPTPKGETGQSAAKNPAGADPVNPLE